MSQFIRIYDDALSADVCQEIIDRFESQPERQKDGVTGHGVDHTRKQSLDITTTPLQDWASTNQKILDVTAKRLAEYVREFMFLVAGALSPTLRDPESGEIYTLNESTFDRLGDTSLTAVIQRLYRPGYLVVQKYLQGVGGYHHWHSETYPRDAQCETLHRVLLFMFYLNDVEDGGETSFYYQDVQVKPKAGRMVIAPAYFTHTHKGHVPVSGDKYIVTSWIKFQRAETVFGQKTPPPRT